MGGEEKKKSERKEPPKKSDRKDLAKAKSERKEVAKKSESKELSKGPHKQMPYPKKGAGEVLLMRHGERVDRVFQQWIKRAWNAKTEYVPFDLNLPVTLPKREGEPKNFRNDGPITELGAGVAKLVGRGLRLDGIKVSAVYASPAVRCVQTANYVLRHCINEMGETASAKKIRVEPGLFEAMGWYEFPPTFMSNVELTKAGFALDHEYKPILSLEELMKMQRESNAAFHTRNVATLTKIVATHEQTESILVVGHAPTVDIGARLLSGEEKEGRDRSDLDQQGGNYPFCSLLALRRTAPDIPYTIHHDIVNSVTATRNYSAPDLAFLDRA